jgi:hypothetical protein
LLYALGSGAPVDQSPLHEIGQHGAAGVCGPLVVHANAAIASELHNHQWLAQTIGRLRTLDVEGNAMTRRQELAQLSAFSGELHDTALRGDDELRRLGDAAERLAGSSHPGGVRAFSEPLADAFAEEQRTAADLAAFVSYLDYVDLHKVRQGPEDPPASAEPNPLVRLPTNADLIAAEPSSPYEKAGSPNLMGRAAGVDFSARLTAVTGLEARAAERSGDAVSGCS